MAIGIAPVLNSVLAAKVMEPGEALVLRGVHSHYGSSHVLHGVDLVAREGQVSSILGRNGAGKTTTLKTIVGLVTARAGSIRLGERELVGLPTHAIAELGVAMVPEERWVFLHGHADMVDQPLLDRVDLTYNSASVLAVREALAGAGVGIDDVATFDLYSCFPVPVFNFCDGTGLATDDPRGLTLTGGLPYFGGPGNNYSLHGIAETVSEMRDLPGQFGLVAANGGIMSKYSVGVYSTAPVNWKPDNSAGLRAEVAARPKVPVTVNADGPATIETYTVRYDWPVHTGIIIGRLDDDGSRFLALTEDPGLVGLLSDGEPLGASIVVRPTEKDNRAALA